MNIHEYQAKQLLKQYGVAVPPGDACQTVQEASAAAAKIFDAGNPLAVVKSQIHAGGRGKGVFQDGFKGGVKLAKSAEEATAHAKAMLGNTLVTKQTGPEGLPVTAVLLEEQVAIARELYLALTLDRDEADPGETG